MPPCPPAAGDCSAERTCVVEIDVRGQLAGHVNKPRHKDENDKESKEAPEASRRSSRAQPPEATALAPTRVCPEFFLLGWSHGPR